MSGLLLAQLWLLALGLWAHRTRPDYAPGAWLLLIAAALGPSVAAGLLLIWPDTGHGVAYALGKPASEPGDAARVADSGASPLRLAAWAYLGIAAALCTRMLVRILRLHRMARRAMPGDGVRLTDAALPPFALGWPDRCVVVARTDWEAMDGRERAMLLAHERTHLAHRDPEFTVVLLALSHLLWINPGLRLLVELWRAAIEMRADRAAASHPKSYSELLLRLSRAQALPLPTAAHGDIRMRIDRILTATIPARLPRTVLALATTAAAGSVALSASAADTPRPIKRVPPVMPASCPDFIPSSAPIEVQADRAEEVNGRTSVFGDAWAKVGEVVVRFDVDAQGVPVDIEVVKTSAACFSMPAVDAVSQWRYAEGAPARGVSNMLRFVMTFEDGDDIMAELESFAGG